jgi:hydroxymethylpyrimidine kinase/phosphomethylpyrimidine kinase
MNKQSIKNILCIGGSDPSGGAGIQADMKTMLELSVFPYTVISAVTAQNSSGVKSFELMTARLIRDQIDMVLADSSIDGLKTGMLGSSENIMEVVRLINDDAIKYSIVDPVLKAGDGKMLSSDASIAVFKKRLIPTCYMVTPNLAEAEILTGVKIKNEDDLVEAAKILKETGAEWVLIKGGHLEGDVAIDLLYDGIDEYFFEAVRIKIPNVRGTGCMMASAICSFLVKGLATDEAVDKAKAYVFAKIAKAVKLGKGSHQALHGPLAVVEKSGVDDGDVRGDINENRTD